MTPSAILNWNPHQILDALGGFDEAAFLQANAELVTAERIASIAWQEEGPRVSARMAKRRCEKLMRPLIEHAFPRKIDPVLLECISFTLQDYEKADAANCSYIYPATLWLWRQHVLGGPSFYELLSLAITVESCIGGPLHRAEHSLRWVLYLATMPEERSFDMPAWSAYWAAAQLLGAILNSDSPVHHDQAVAQLSEELTEFDVDDIRIWRRAAQAVQAVAHKTSSAVDQIVQACDEAHRQCSGQRQ